MLNSWIRPDDPLARDARMKNFCLNLNAHAGLGIQHARNLTRKIRGARVKDDRADFASEPIKSPHANAEYSPLRKLACEVTNVARHFGSSRS